MIAKRLFDVAFASAALVLLAVPFAAIAVAVRLGSAGPAFFRQERVGLNGGTFRIWKFRTMRAGAQENGSLVTPAGDSRITPLGAFLRRWKLDELPQLVNVLAGQMSVVGPRPEVPRYVAAYTPAQRRVLSVRPGMTDYASIDYVDEEHRLAGADDVEATYLHDVLPRKLELNLRYIDERSFLGDLKLVLRTLGRVLRYRRWT